MGQQNQEIVSSTRSEERKFARKAELPYHSHVSSIQVQLCQLRVEAVEYGSITYSSPIFLTSNKPQPVPMSVS